MEIVSPVGSLEAVAAAVKQGADAVVMGYGPFHTYRKGTEFTREQFWEAVAYCRLRSINIYVLLDALLTDRELFAAAEWVRELSVAGVDALVVQDVGVARMVKAVSPEMEMHASAAMGVHSLGGVTQAAAMGLGRVALPPMLRADDIAHIAKYAPIPVSVQAHGRLCASYAGQCHLSSVMRRQAGGRGLCAELCRGSFGFANRDGQTPLSHKDFSLLDYTDELQRCGVAALTLDDGPRAPEYTAVLTRVFHQAVHEGNPPSPQDYKEFNAMSPFASRSLGYYAGQLDATLLGVRVKEEPDGKKTLPAGLSYGTSLPERQSVKVEFACLIAEGVPTLLAAEDDRGHCVTVKGPVPRADAQKSLEEAAVNTQLYKTAGTFYKTQATSTHVGKNLSLPLSVIQDMRRDALAELTTLRKKLTVCSEGAYRPGVKALLRKEKPEVIVQVASARQLSAELITLPIPLFYLPLDLCLNEPSWIERIQSLGKKVVPVLPRILSDAEVNPLLFALQKARGMGLDEVLLGNMGHLKQAAQTGFTPRGDFGLNITNSQAVKEYKRMGLASVTLSFELSFAQILDMSHSINTEILAYGRLPLLITPQCLIYNKHGCHACENPQELVDENGARYPVAKDTSCRNVLYSGSKLFLADRMRDFAHIGLWGARLYFTTENARECIQVAERYLGWGSYEPNNVTQGLYYTGIEL